MVEGWIDTHTINIEDLVANMATLDPEGELDSSSNSPIATTQLAE